MGAEIQRAARENEAYQRRTTISGVPAISKPDIRTGRFQSVKFILGEPADIRYGSEQLTLFKPQSIGAGHLPSCRFQLQLRGGLYITDKSIPRELPLASENRAGVGLILAYESRSFR